MTNNGLQRRESVDAETIASAVEVRVSIIIDFNSPLGYNIAKPGIIIILYSTVICYHSLSYY